VTDAPREITVEDLDYLDKMAEHYGKQPSDGWVIGYDEWVMVSAAARRALSHAGGEMPKHCPDCGRMLVPFQIRSEGDLPGLPLHAGEALFVFPASQPPSPLEREREHDRQCREFAAMNPEDRHPGNEPLPLPDTPQSVPTCTCSKHPLWDGYDGDCPIHGWFEPVAPDTPQSVPADEQERVGFGYDAGVKCMRCGAKAGEPHLKFCPRLPDRLNEKYEAELDATPDAPAMDNPYPCEADWPDAPLSQGRYAKSVTAGQAKMSEQIEALIAERDAYRNSVAPIQNRLEALEAERDKLGTDIALHESLAHGYTDQIATLEVLAQSRLTDLEAFKAYADRLEAERDKLKEKLAAYREAQAKHVDRGVQIDKLKQENRALIQDYGATHADLWAKNAKLVERVSVLEDALRIADISINPPDRDGISLNIWNARLAGATSKIRAALRTPEDA
jgi:hypothetical protein